MVTSFGCPGSGLSVSCFMYQIFRVWLGVCVGVVQDELGLGFANRRSTIGAQAEGTYFNMLTAVK